MLLCLGSPWAAVRRGVVLVVVVTLVSGAFAVTAGAAATVEHSGAKATTVLAHGAWAEPNGFYTEINKLPSLGYPTVTIANPLRGLLSDAVRAREACDDQRTDGLAWTRLRLSGSSSTRQRQRPAQDADSSALDTFWRLRALVTTRGGQAFVLGRGSGKP
jgi:hypothetical protein